MANEQERHARNRLIDETRAAVEKLIREYRKAAKVAARTAEEHEREWHLAKLAQGVERERDLALREAEKFKNYSRQADQEIAQLRAELARLTTPRPIAEAPRDGTWISAVWEDMTPEECARFGLIAVVRWSGTRWEDSDGDGYEPPSHFLPLPEVKP